MGEAIRVAVVGATGYGGAELVRLLSEHPLAKVVIATSERLAGTRLSDDCPWLATDLILQSFDPESLLVDFVFLAQEAGFAMLHAPNLLRKSRVVDLSADFRLKDKDVYAATYKREWASPGLEVEPVYGLPEAVDRDTIRNATLVANPGCHATNTILGLRPLVENGLLDGIPVVDSKSGVSGAGRSRKETDYLFAEMTGNFKGYAVTGHRHIPEIEQEIGVRIRFTPHLVPESRGIYTTIHAPVKLGTTLEQIKAGYPTSTFVRVVDQIPSTKQVLGSNRVDIHVALDEHTGFAVVSVVQDNLVKGAAGQAIQNMNLMAGLPEETGLPIHGVWP
ncbi:MAG: N-acetyl-gamma-glutamyl-phosphate reductase [Chlorobia bacterium]|nr:N-acetyl-gamma-glutamyl-phosphate reductase [Fimbriimonadaceae bacterium]